MLKNVQVASYSFGVIAMCVFNSISAHSQTPVIGAANLVDHPGGGGGGPSAIADAVGYADGEFYGSIKTATGANSDRIYAIAPTGVSDTDVNQDADGTGISMALPVATLLGPPPSNQVVNPSAAYISDATALRLTGVAETLSGSFAGGLFRVNSTPAGLPTGTLPEDYVYVLTGSLTVNGNNNSVGTFEQHSDSFAKNSFATFDLEFGFTARVGFIAGGVQGYRDIANPVASGGSVSFAEYVSLDEIVSIFSQGSTGDLAEANGTAVTSFSSGNASGSVRVLAYPASSAPTLNLNLAPVASPISTGITNVTFGNKENRRSIVDNIQIELGSHVNVSGDTFTLTNTTTQEEVASLVINNSVANGKSTITLTFAPGASVDARAPANSLADGLYELRIHHDEIETTAGEPVLADDFVYFTKDFAVFRLFGDSDGDADVDGQDFGRFGQAFLSTSADPNYNPDFDFDFDGDGDVDGSDYGQFGIRFFTSL